MIVLAEGRALAPLTTLGVGGPARLFVTCTSDAELVEAARTARARGLPLLPLGGGSNILVPDEGAEGLVAKIEIGGIRFDDEQGRARVTAGAGVSWDELVDASVTRGLWGMENLSGIPGTVGGAVVQNIGAYGAVLADVLESIHVYDQTAEAETILDKREYAPGYRTSIFKQERGRYVALGATFSLSAAPRPVLGYPDLAKRFVGEIAPALATVREAVLSIRFAKFPDIAHGGTAGSFFRNPVLPAEEARAIAARFPGLPLFPMPEGGVKVPIAWFLDFRHGVMDVRDLKIGGASPWPAQPLVIAAARETKARDIDLLATEIAKRLYDATGIVLEREVETFTARA